MKKALLLCILLCFLSGCTGQRNENIPYVDFIPAKYQKVESDKTYQGYIDRGLDVELSFALSGVMNGIYVVEGEFVKKGKLLAKLDNDEYKFNITRAQSELDDAYVKFNRAKSYFERITKLHSAGGISYNDWEEAQTNLKSSVNQIKILDDALKIAKNKETFSNIYAPYDGYVIKTFKDKMQFASAGERVILFQGEGMLEARVFVSENSINDIKIGDRVILTSDAIKNREYEGKIKSKVNSSINEGSYRVTVSVLDNAPELLDGMSVNVFVPNENKTCKILVPTSSVLAEKDKKYVFVLKKETENKGVVYKREIVTGDIYNNEIEIKCGIKEGEFVVIEGVNKIMNASLVRFL